MKVRTIITGRLGYNKPSLNDRPTAIIFWNNSFTVEVKDSRPAGGKEKDELYDGTGKRVEAVVGVREGEGTGQRGNETGQTGKRTTGGGTKTTRSVTVTFKQTSFGDVFKNKSAIILAVLQTSEEVSVLTQAGVEEIVQQYLFSKSRKRKERGAI